MPANEPIIEEGRTRFNDQGVRPPHLNRTEALAKANDAMERLKDEAESWLSADMERLSGMLDGLSDGPLPNATALDPVYRTVCSIRDTSGHFGNSGLCVLADGMCELTARMADAGLCHVASLHTHYQALQLVHGAGTDALSPQQIEQLSTNLQALLKRFSSTA